MKKESFIWTLTPMLVFVAKLARRTGVHAAVYLTSAMEYLVAEVLELSGCAAHDNKKGRISPRHIMLAIR